MNTTTIEWATHTWNPVTGCSPISEGCENCYAKRMAQRLRGRCGYPEDEPFRVTLHRDRLEEPLKLRKPSRIFVCSMGDLFHPAVPDKWIDRIFAIMALTPQHIYQMLTKRPGRMRQYLDRLQIRSADYGGIRGASAYGVYRAAEAYDSNLGDSRFAGMLVTAFLSNREAIDRPGWPLPNVWLGVTVENNNNLWRIEELLQIPAAVRFVCCEPMLGPVDLRLGQHWLISVGGGYGKFHFLGHEHEAEEMRAHKARWEGAVAKKRWLPGIDWVICGGETGPGARPMHPDWVRLLRDQCQVAGVPFLFKQWGEYREACAPDDPIWNGQAPKLRHEHGMHFIKLGAKKTGRILDGEIWDEYPEEKA
jgi:protein gp37